MIASTVIVRIRAHHDRRFLWIEAGGIYTRVVITSLALIVCIAHIESVLGSGGIGLRDDVD